MAYYAVEKDGESLVQCPYDKSHMIRRCRIQRHLVKCAKNHENSLKICPFNALHHIAEPFFKEHLLSCEHRTVVDQEIYGAAPPKPPPALVDAHGPVPPAWQPKASMSSKVSVSDWGEDLNACPGPQAVFPIVPDTSLCGIVQRKRDKEAIFDNPTKYAGMTKSQKKKIYQRRLDNHNRSLQGLPPLPESDDEENNEERARNAAAIAIMQTMVSSQTANTNVKPGDFKLPLTVPKVLNLKAGSITGQLNPGSRSVSPTSSIASSSWGASGRGRGWARGRRSISPEEPRRPGWVDDAPPAAVPVFVGGDQMRSRNMSAKSTISSFSSVSRQSPPRRPVAQQDSFQMSRSQTMAPADKNDFRDNHIMSRLQQYQDSLQEIRALERRKEKGYELTKEQQMRVNSKEKLERILDTLDNVLGENSLI